MKKIVTKSDEGKGIEEKLPPIEQQVMVQGEGFRCLAYRDKDGKWRDVFRQSELKGRIRVL